jgi:hypothetical protein
MPQRVEYDVFPNTRPEQLPGKLHAAFNLDGGLDGVGFKAYRSYLREQGLWDKSRVETIFSLVDVSWDRERVTFGSLARSIRESHEEEVIQDAIFARLRQENGLLVKYVFDALDVESGGRLHSDNELYRMITSYVYPGDFITLTSFQSWIHWMAGAGVLKIVGIRWALTERALEVLPTIRSMDVEEILEDLEEEQELAAASESAPAPEPAPALQARTPDAPEPPSVSSDPAEATDASFEEEEELPDMGMPPEAEPPSEAEIALAEARFVEDFGDVDRPEPLSRVVSSTPVASLSVPESTGMLAARSDLEEIAAQLTLAWDDGAHWPSYTASQLGIEVSTSREASEVLVELGVVSLLLEGLAVQPQVFSFVAHLRSSDFFGKLTNEGLGDALDALDLSVTPPAHQALAERLIHSHGVAGRVAQAPDLLAQFSAAKAPSAAVALIHDQLLGGTGKEACFWVLRELLRGGLLPDEMGQCAVVPTARLLEHAHRLGIVPRTDLDTLEDLMVASSAVAGSFGPESGYGEALEVMDRLTRLASEAP